LGSPGKRNIVSVSWSDHLVFGEGDGRLDTLESVGRRMTAWREELGAGLIHWHCTRDRIKGRYFAAAGHQHFFRARKPDVRWDDFLQVPRLAHGLGMAVLLYVSLFDEGWPLPAKPVREVSFHNLMHGRHESWQTEFGGENPQYAVSDRTRRKRQRGVLSLAYPEVREHFIARYRSLLDEGEFDGLFVCLRSQSRPADFADEYGFNEPVRGDFQERYGRDIWSEDFDLQAWRDLLGDYLTRFLAEVRQSLPRHFPLAVGVPRGRVLGPPLGNTSLEWQRWVRAGIVDHLVVDQNSSKCPSLWHELWPMHRGYGYLQNYLDGLNMKPLQEDLSVTYHPVFEGERAKLYVARQWRERSETEERSLLGHPTVAGLVFSSFRHDNPGPVSRNEWWGYRERG
jgi:hypothetical protein